MSENPPSDRKPDIPSSKKEEALDAEGQKVSAEFVIAEIKGETGSSEQWAISLQTVFQYKGIQLEPQNDLTPEQLDRFRNAKTQLETAFGDSTIKVLNAWQEALPRRLDYIARHPD